MTSFRNDPEGWLKEAIVKPEKKLVFFVGAGISIDSGLPNFLKFSSDFISSICPSNLEKKKSIGSAEDCVLKYCSRQLSKSTVIAL